MTHAPDPDRWPFTSVVLSMLDKLGWALDARAPTLVWAYGAALDRHEVTVRAMLECRP